MHRRYVVAVAAASVVLAAGCGGADLATREEAVQSYLARADGMCGPRVSRVNLINRSIRGHQPRAVALRFTAILASERKWLAEMDALAVPASLKTTIAEYTHDVEENQGAAEALIRAVAEHRYERLATLDATRKTMEVRQEKAWRATGLGECGEPGPLDAAEQRAVKTILHQARAKVATLERQRATG